MKKLFALIIQIFVANMATAQHATIMVCNAAGNSCAQYENLDTAIVNASPGSYIYIPGGSFPIYSVINKEIHLIGAGSYPDSTNVTGISQIDGSILLAAGCDNSSFEGLFIVNGFSRSITSSIDTFNNLVFNKISLNGFSFNTANTPARFRNCLIKDCILKNTASIWFQIPFLSSTITNCIISGNIRNLHYSNLENCIIYGSFDNCYGCDVPTGNTITNSIFDSVSINPTRVCQNCIFKNNFTVYNSLGIIYISIETGTIGNIPYSNLYTNAPTKGFSYTKDFHLKTTSPGHNAGTDGTDVGIYGGSLPYTEGAVPGNPHIFYKNVVGTTNSAGNLPVNIKTRIGH